MTIERAEALELALNQFRHYENRIIIVTVAGFVLGLIVGIATALLLMH